MSNERQINYVNEIQNRVQNLYYVDDATELNSINLKENDKIYAINNDKLFQMEIADQDEELSGSIVSFNGRNNTKIKSVVANIVPIQSGTGDPSPDNVRPISGWTGANITGAEKNLCNPSTIITGVFVRAGNTSESSPLGSLVNNAAWKASDYIRVKPSTVYTTCLSKYYVAGAAGLVFFAGTSVDSAISGVPTARQGSTNIYTFTTPSNCHYIRFSWYDGSDGTDYPLPMLVEGTDTLYQAYNAQTLPINWQDEAGTIYSGSFTLNEDGSVDVVKLNEIVDFDSLTWSVVTTRTYPVFVADFPFASDRAVEHVGVELCSIYKPITNVTMATFGESDEYNRKICFNAGISTAYRLMIQDSGCETLTDFESRILGQTAICKLAIPQTYHISNIGQLQAYLGTNNVWSDINDITVKIAEKGITAFELKPYN